MDQQCVLRMRESLGYVHCRREARKSIPDKYLATRGKLHIYRCKALSASVFTDHPEISLPIALSTPLSCHVSFRSLVVNTLVHPAANSASFRSLTQSGLPFVDTYTLRSLSPPPSASAYSRLSSVSRRTIASISSQHRANMYCERESVSKSTGVPFQSGSRGGPGGRYGSGRKGSWFHPSNSAQPVHGERMISKRRGLIISRPVAPAIHRQSMREKFK